MKITRISADNYRNLSGVNIYPHETTNVFYGKNAQGKTNLIEAIWCMSGIKSFRGARDKDILKYDSDDRLELEIDYEDDRRENNLKLSFSGKYLRDKKVFVNGVDVKNMSGLFGKLSCVVFTPEDLEISKGSPEVRRDFLDLSISQIKNSYAKIVDRYNETMHQRNAVLKNMNRNDPDYGLIEIYDQTLATMGCYMTSLRNMYMKKLSATASELYRKISGGKEELTLTYVSTIFDDLDKETRTLSFASKEYLSILKMFRESDLRSGFTSVGVHRDDVIAKINGMNARDYASQGQHRSIALCLKLAQAYILAQEQEDYPIILLDDILSELDKDRQNFVLSQIENMQVFITCCDKIPQLGNGKVFEIENGRVKQRS